MSKRKRKRLIAQNQTLMGKIRRLSVTGIRETVGLSWWQANRGLGGRSGPTLDRTIVEIAAL